MSEMSVLHMELGRDSYDVVVERGVLKRAGALLNPVSYTHLRAHETL